MSEFSEYIREVFAPIGAVSIRRMFGGQGVFLDGLMIALVADEALYLKVDEHSREQFTARGLAPFVYSRRGKPVALGYHAAPEEMFDDEEAARHWGRLAHDAALRGARRRPPRRSR